MSDEPTFQMCGQTVTLSDIREAVYRVTAETGKANFLEGVKALCEFRMRARPIGRSVANISEFHRKESGE